MEGVTVLEFKEPVGDKVTENGGEFDAPRHYGGHKGVDFESNWGHDVFASERGKVVFSGMVEGSKTKTNYGNVVVIDHTFEHECGGRYLYTLYAHLNTRSAGKGDIVEKQEVVGTSGNSGTRQSYSGKKPKYQKDYHLHFELIDSPRELIWSWGSWNSISLRKDPFSGYIGSTITLDCAGAVVGDIARFGIFPKTRPFGRRHMM